MKFKLLMEAEPTSMKIIAVHIVSLPFEAEKPKHVTITVRIQSRTKANNR